MGSEEIVSKYILLVISKENVPCWRMGEAHPSPVLCIVVIVVVAGDGLNPEDEHERSFRGCPMAAVVVVVAARKEMRIEMNSVGFCVRRLFNVT